MPGCASARGAAKALASLPSSLCLLQGCCFAAVLWSRAVICAVHDDAFAMRWPKVIISGGPARRTSPWAGHSYRFMDFCVRFGEESRASGCKTLASESDRSLAHTRSGTVRFAWASQQRAVRSRVLARGSHSSAVAAAPIARLLASCLSCRKGLLARASNARCRAKYATTALPGLRCFITVWTAQASRRLSRGS